MHYIFLVLLYCTTALCSLKHPLQDPEGGTFDIEKNYKINFNSNENGGCKDYEKQVRQSYRDALEMIDTAREALDDLRSPIPAGSDLAVDRNEWLRKAEAYIAMFNQRPRKLNVPAGQEPLDNRARDVWEYLRSWVNQHQKAEADNPEVWFFCKDSFLKWREPSYPDPDWDPTQGGQPPRLGDYKECKKGGYVAEVLPRGQRKWCVQAKGGPDVQNPLCADNKELASTFYREKIIMFCPDLLNTPRWDVREHRMRVQPGAHIENYINSYAQIWTHEWVHLLQEWPDQPAVTKNGLPDISLKGTRNKSYGWSSSHFLAANKYSNTKEEREAAIPNPDNFALFALAMYLDNFWWGTGYARSQPENVGPQRRDGGNTTMLGA